MEFYRIKVQHPSNTFIALVQEYDDLFKVKFGGTRACVYFSVYKKGEKEYPNLDSVGSHPECNLAGNLPNKEGTIILIKSSLKFLVWRFPYVKHAQFIDASTKECFKKISIDLPTFHFGKYGKTWYQDKLDAVLIDNNVKKVMEKANRSLETPYSVSWDAFFESNIKRYEGMMQKIEHKHFYDMLHICWQEGKTYRDFIRNIADRDCILLQVWLKHYISKLWKNVDTPLAWKIKKTSIDSWDIDMSIKSTNKRPSFLQLGGDITNEKYNMSLFMNRRR